jgi:hypothetical protein
MAVEGSDTKVCPYCAETIKAGAVVCRHCGLDLKTGRSTRALRSPSVSSAVPAVQARSSVEDGVKLGCGMFIVLPLLLLFGGIFFVMCVGSMAQGPHN